VVSVYQIVVIQLTHVRVFFAGSECKDRQEPEYLEGEGAEQILAAYTDNMIARGYAAATNKESASNRDNPTTIQAVNNW